MYIRNLMEDTKGCTDVCCEHGLSFYVETAEHKLLFDVGQTGLFLENARRLAIDLSQVDTVILSHGHYDHGGGLSAFLEINEKAEIYVREGAFEPHVSIHGEGPEGIHPIGLDQELVKNPRIHMLKENTWLDETMFVFGGVTDRKLWAASNQRLRSGKDGYPQDDFAHEQDLWLRAEGKEILFAGCSHSGIVNIIEKFEELAGCQPDVVIGGFHLINPRGKEELDLELLEGTADYLKTKKANYYTGHCTGISPYEWLRAQLGDRITYVHAGDEILF